MSTGPLQQVPSTAIDADGLSITTSIKSSLDPRPGHAYNPDSLAAAAIVHLHPYTSPSLGGTNYLMMMSQRWTTATPDAANPGAYTDYTPTTVPSWVHLNAANGHTSAINSGFEIPMKTANDSRTLTSAVSRGNDMLWALYATQSGETASAVVQHWHVNTVINTVNLRAEETIPAATNGDDQILFSAGLQWNSVITPYMYAYGLGSSTGQVYVARKTWARVGYVGTARNPVDSQWEVYTGDGWSPDLTQAGPVQTATGPLTSKGPLSFGYYGMKRALPGTTLGLTGYTFMSTVTAAGDARSAQIWSSLRNRPWTPTGAPITLGNQGSTYLGGTLQFQPNVAANPAMIDPAASATALPYLTSVMSTSGGASSINVDWGLLQVPRLS